MTKLEELSELLVSEIKDFEEAVKKLQVIREAKIDLNIGKLKEVLAAHEKAIIDSTNIQRNHINRLQEVIGKAKIYPKWAVMIFIISLILNGATVAWLLLR
jgi:predicted kinase